MRKAGFVRNAEEKYKVFYFCLMFGFFSKKEEKIQYPPPEEDEEIKITTVLAKDTPLKEKDGEHTFLWEKGVQMAYLKDVSQGYLGASIRVTRGLRFFYGGQAKAQKLVQEGIGDLFLTNKRMVFIGSFNTFEVSLNKINSVQKFIDGYLGISIIGKSKNPLFFLKDKIYLWATAIEQIDEMENQYKMKYDEIEKVENQNKK